MNILIHNWKSSPSSLIHPQIAKGQEPGFMCLHLSSLPAALSTGEAHGGPQKHKTSVMASLGPHLQLDREFWARIEAVPWSTVASTLPSPAPAASLLIFYHLLIMSR